MTTDKNVEKEDLTSEDRPVEEKDQVSEEEVVEEEEKKEDQLIEEEISDNVSVDVDELKNQLVRLQADFSNYKKRIEKEREGYIELGVKKLAIDLLPVLDNLERALKSIEDHAGDSEIFKGINMIDDQIIEVLKKNNIVEIKAEGEKFDPNLHHAVAVVETEDMDEDMVVDVFQKGYQINDSVIRPSMVRVSKK